MGLCVEDVLVQTEQLQVVGEEQVEVLERLTEEEALHLVSRARVVRVAHVVDGRVAAVRDLRGGSGWAGREGGLVTGCGDLQFERKTHRVQ